MQTFSVRGLVAICLLSGMSLAATANLNLYFSAELTDAQYKKKAFAKAAAAWKTPPPAVFPETGKKVVVQAVIAKDGKLISATVTTPSGSKKWDELALTMVKTAAPFDPLPPGYPRATVEAHFHVSAE